MNGRLVKWIVVNCAIVLGFVALDKTGLLVEIFQMDSTGITIMVLCLFGLAHFAVLKLAIAYDEALEIKLWFIAETLIALGMIGTVVGFTMLFGDAFQNLNLEDTATIMAALSDIAAGMGTALMTTLAGLVCSLILKGELVFIAEDV